MAVRCFHLACTVYVAASLIMLWRKTLTDPLVSSWIRLEIRLTQTPRMSGHVRPWMIWRRTQWWRLAPPFPGSFPHSPRPDMGFVTLCSALYWERSNWLKDWCFSVSIFLASKRNSFKFHSTAWSFIYWVSRPHQFHILFVLGMLRWRHPVPSPKTWEFHRRVFAYQKKEHLNDAMGAPTRS